MEKQEIKEKVKELIQECMDSLQLDPLGLGRKLGFNNAKEVSRWMRGDNIPSSAILFKMSGLLGKQVSFTDKDGKR